MADMGQPSPSGSAAQKAREQALVLSQRRKAIDAELQKLADVLSREGVNLTSPLVDSEGFPLNSVDIPTVREARSKIIALRNDRNDIDGELNNLLHVALARTDP